MTAPCSSKTGAPEIRRAAISLTESPGPNDSTSFVMSSVARIGGLLSLVDERTFA